MVPSHEKFLAAARTVSVGRRDCKSTGCRTCRACTVRAFHTGWDYRELMFAMIRVKTVAVNVYPAAKADLGQLLRL